MGKYVTILLLSHLFVNSVWINFALIPCKTTPFLIIPIATFISLCSILAQWIDDNWED